MAKRFKRRKGRIHYSSEEKKRYHERRSKLSDGIKSYYSREWLSGFNEQSTHLSNNLYAAKREFELRRKNKVPFSDYDIGLIAYRNGLSCRLKSKK